VDSHISSVKGFKNLIKMSEETVSTETVAKGSESFYNPALYDLEEEYKQYGDMLLSGKQDKNIFFRLGRIHQHWGNIDVAKKFYLKAVELAPDDSEIHYNFGNLLLKEKNYLEARKEFAIAVKNNPSDVYALNAMAKTCFKVKEFKEAEAYNKMALEVHPSDVYALRGLGDIFMAQKNYNEAVKYYLKALEINPADTITLYNIGLAYLLLDKVGKGEQHFKSCLEKDKNFPGFYFGLGFCYYKLDKKKEAFEYCKIGLELSKDSVEYISYGDYERTSDICLEELNEIKEKILGKDFLDGIDEEMEVKRKQDNIDKLLEIDVLSLEVGRGLISLVDPNKGGKLLDRVTSIRRHIALEMGLFIPGIRFRDNLQLNANGYIIKIKEFEVARGEVFVGQYMAIGPDDSLKSLDGIKAVDPAYNMPAVWIKESQLIDAEKVGCMIFEPVSVMATHITEIIRNNAHDLIDIQHVDEILERVKKTHPAIVKEIYPRLFTLGDIQKVLRNLLREKVSIRDIITILETLIHYAHVTKDADILTEYVRQALSRIICMEHQNPAGVISVINLDQELEEIIYTSLSKSPRGMSISLSTDTCKLILSAVDDKVHMMKTLSMEPIILCSHKIRPYVKKLISKTSPDVLVISNNEIAANFKITILDTIKLPSHKIIEGRDRKIIARKNIFTYIEMLQKDNNPSIRCEAVKSLIPLANSFNLPKIFEYLDKGFEDKDDSVRHEASKVLRELLEKYCKSE